MSGLLSGEREGLKPVENRLRAVRSRHCGGMLDGLAHGIYARGCSSRHGVLTQACMRVAPWLQAGSWPQAGSWLPGKAVAMQYAMQYAKLSALPTHTVVVACTHSRTR